jgi:flagellar biosynthesis/type III secretory pathway chaperone
VRTREYPAVVEELERAFEKERKAILSSDVEGISRSLSGVEELLDELLEALRTEEPRRAAEVLKWAARRCEENASLLRARMEEIGAEVSRLRRGRRAVAAYSPPLPGGSGRAVDSDV